MMVSIINKDLASCIEAIVSRCLVGCRETSYVFTYVFETHALYVTQFAKTKCIFSRSPVYASMDK